MRGLRRLILALLLLTPIGSSAQAPAIHRLDGSTIAAADIDAAIAHVMKAAEVPGVAIAVLNDGRIVYTKAYG